MIASKTLGAVLILALTVAMTSLILSASISAVEPEHPFDAVPGLGRSVANAVRDDVFAVYDAYRQEHVTAACMEDAGFAYVPDLAYPSGPLLAVAEALGIAVTTGGNHELDPDLGLPVDAPAVQNFRYVDALPREWQDRYWLALVGETVDDVESMEQNDGQVPLHRDGESFMRGGCTGTAAVDVGSVWDLKRELAQEWEASRAYIFTDPGYLAGEQQFAACMATAATVAASNPGDVENLLATASQSESDEIVEAYRMCEPHYVGGYDKAERTRAQLFVQQHAAEIDLHTSAYANLRDIIESDAAFRDYLTWLCWLTCPDDPSPPLPGDG